MALFSKYCSQSTVSKVRQSMSGFWPLLSGVDFEGINGEILVRQAQIRVAKVMSVLTFLC